MSDYAERIKLSKFWLSFFCIKIFWWLFAVLVYARLTQLGDTDTYLYAPFVFYPVVLYNSSAMMGYVGSFCLLIFKVPLLANLPFALLTYFSIKYAVERLNLKKDLFLLLLLSLPTFSVWTSICSKESVSVFYGAVLVVYVIDFFKHPRWPGWVEVLALYLGAVFKPFNIVFFLEVLAFLFIIRKFAIKRMGILVLFLLFVFANLSGLYFFRDFLDNLSRSMDIYFNYANANSNRVNDIWVQQYDIFRHAPYAMFIGFMGPTITEMMHNPLHLLAGLESYFVLFMMIYLLWPSMGKLSVFGRIDAAYLAVVLLIFFGLLFVQSLYGALNPGSAVRYRENIYLIFVLLLLYKYQRNQQYLEVS